MWPSFRMPFNIRDIIPYSILEDLVISEIGIYCVRIHYINRLKEIAETLVRISNYSLEIA